MTTVHSWSLFVCPAPVAVCFLRKRESICVVRHKIRDTNTLAKDVELSLGRRPPPSSHPLAGPLVPLDMCRSLPPHQLSPAVELVLSQFIVHGGAVAVANVPAGTSFASIHPAVSSFLLMMVMMLWSPGIPRSIQGATQWSPPPPPPH